MKNTSMFAMPHPRVLVCGGRKFGRMIKDPKTKVLVKSAEQAQQERDWLFFALQGIYDGGRMASLIHGGEPRGADFLAGQFAMQIGLPYAVFKPDWQKYAGAAGPIRNAEMLEVGKPDLVVAFPGGRGTADMVDRAKRAGVHVLELET